MAAVSFIRSTFILRPRQSSLRLRNDAPKPLHPPGPPPSSSYDGAVGAFRSPPPSCPAGRRHGRDAARRAGGLRCRSGVKARVRASPSTQRAGLPGGNLAGQGLTLAGEGKNKTKKRLPGRPGPEGETAARGGAAGRHGGGAQRPGPEGEWLRDGHGCRGSTLSPSFQRAFLAASAPRRARQHRLSPAPAWRELGAWAPEGRRPSGARRERSAGSPGTGAGARRKAARDGEGRAPPTPKHARRPVPNPAVLFSSLCSSPL